MYAGGTMAFTAGYWALGHYKPAQIAFLGCDMYYPKSTQTHFYGKGSPDPLRDDISLRSLEAKANRLYAHAEMQGCAITNLSTGRSRLTFPRHAIGAAPPERLTIDTAKRTEALTLEQKLGYFTPSGRYWEDSDRFDPKVIDALDACWLDAVKAA